MSTGGGTLDILLGLPEPIVRYPATPAVPVRYPATAGLSDMNRSCLWSLYEAHTEEDSRILLTWGNREKWGFHTGYVLFFFVRPLACIRLGLSLVLICCRATCDTVPIWETKLPATEARAVFTAGMPAKLTRVQLCRHASGKDQRCFLLPAALCPHTSENQASQWNLVNTDTDRGHRKCPY